MGCEKCGGCGGHCGGCSGCGGCGTLELTDAEVRFLELLGQFAFLPVARKADDMTPVCLEDETAPEALCSQVLQCLEKKSLISIDYSAPLSGADMRPYAGYPVHGSIALTARGQQVLDLLEKNGIQP